MAEGYEVSPSLLRQAAEDIDGVVGELSAVDIDALALSGGQLGNERLRSSLSSFCDTWSAGVRAQVDEGNRIASLLGCCAVAYDDMERYAVDALTARASEQQANRQ